MRLDDINFNKLQRYHYSWWGSGKQLRYHYYDDLYYYKIWSRGFDSHKLINTGGSYSHYKYDKSIYLSSFACGLVDLSICPAFVDYINDDKNYCRGYITLKGKALAEENEIPKTLVSSLVENSIKSGFAFPDLKPLNVIRIGDNYSLIDLDSPPVCLKSIDLEFQKKEGFLRKSSCKYYADSILNHLLMKNPSMKNP